MKLNYYGHSCFSVEIGNQTLLFDPFITPNDLAKHIDTTKVKADFILISHGHGDHIADCVAIAQSTNATVICNWEIHEWLNNKKDIINTHPMNMGGRWNFGSFSVRCTVAQHSSSLPDGGYAGNPIGFIVTSSEGNFYYSGDTGITLDMQLIPGWAKLSFAVLPIGGNFTMDAEDAVVCAKMIQCNTIVGVHYDTFEIIKVNQEKAIKSFADADLQLRLVKIGNSIEL